MYSEKRWTLNFLLMKMTADNSANLRERERERVCVYERRGSG